MLDNSMDVYNIDFDISQFRKNILLKCNHIHLNEVDR